MIERTNELRLVSENGVNICSQTIQQTGQTIFRVWVDIPHGQYPVIFVTGHQLRDLSNEAGEMLQWLEAREQEAKP